jgi:hypothetical protein
MIYNISDLNELEIEIDDGASITIVPKFRLVMEVDEPFITLNYTDSEKGSGGVTRQLTMDYADVMFGYLIPSSASEVQQVIESYIVSAWAPVKYYGSFYDTTPTQTAALINTGYPVAIGSVTDSNGVNIINGDEITVDNLRIYNLQYSIQFTNSDSQFHAVNVWLRNGGFDLPDTNSRYSVPSKHGSTNGSLIAAINYVFQISPLDTIQLMWATEDVDVVIESIPATAFCPATPGVILTLTDGN